MAKYKTANDEVNKYKTANYEVVWVTNVNWAVILVEESYCLYRRVRVCARAKSSWLNPNTKIARNVYVTSFGNVCYYYY